MTVQPGLCRTRSETPKTGFLRTRLIYSLVTDETPKNCFFCLILVRLIGFQLHMWWLGSHFVYTVDLLCTLTLCASCLAQISNISLTRNVSTESGWCLFKTIQDIWKEMKSVLWSQNRHSYLFSSLYIWSGSRTFLCSKVNKFCMIHFFTAT